MLDAVNLIDDLDVLELFRLALGLVPPWQVTSVELDQEGGMLQIGLDFPRGSRSVCPCKGCAESACAVRDTEE